MGGLCRCGQLALPRIGGGGTCWANQLPASPAGRGGVVPTGVRGATPGHGVELQPVREGPALPATGGGREGPPAPLLQEGQQPPGGGRAAANTAGGKMREFASMHFAGCLGHCSTTFLICVPACVSHTRRWPTKTADEWMALEYHTPPPLLLLGDSGGKCARVADDQEDTEDPGWWHPPGCLSGAAAARTTLGGDWPPACKGRCGQCPGAEPSLLRLCSAEKKRVKKLSCFMPRDGETSISAERR